MENKAVNRKYEHVTAIYWCVWTALLSGYQPADNALGHYLGRMACGWSVVWGLLAFLKIKIGKQSANKRISRKYGRRERSGIYDSGMPCIFGRNFLGDFFLKNYIESHVDRREERKRSAGKISDPQAS